MIAETFSETWAELSEYSIPEIVAVVASITYVLLAARQNRLCWPAAFLGSSLYIVIFWQYQLLMDSALNVYYAAMAIYGWTVWSSRSPATAGGETTEQAPIRQLSWRSHGLVLVLVIVMSLASGYWLDNNSNAAFPYLDSLTTWSSLLATWMVARKILENWLYWIAIDALSLYLYINKDLYFTALLFIVYIIIAIYGYSSWRETFLQQQTPLTQQAS